VPDGPFRLVAGLLLPQLDDERMYFGLWNVHSLSLKRTNRRR
jgi:hypothetical protein